MTHKAALRNHAGGAMFPTTTPPIITNMNLITDWLRITRCKGFIEDGKLKITQADLERCGFDQTLRTWERRIIQEILKGETSEAHGTEIVVLP